MAMQDSTGGCFREVGDTFIEIHVPALHSAYHLLVFRDGQEVNAPCHAANAIGKGLLMYGSLYVCVLISSVKTERVPVKNSARKESGGEKDSQSEPATPALPSGAIVRTQTEAGTR
jgi:hypothetical protein